MAGFMSVDGYIYKQLEAEFKKGGIEDVGKCVKSNLDQWKSATVSIAVTGGSGAGKSTFINIFRNVRDDDPDAAKTGVTETTSEIKSYKDPTNSNIQLFDLPGVGTKKFPKNEYLGKININQFDIFLLMTATRFTENDAWLAEQLLKHNKPLCLVRTKVWHDVQNKNRNVSNTTPVKDILDEIRTDCTDHLKDRNVTIYLVDSFEEREKMLDFMKLREAVLEDLPEQKKKALLYAIADFTKLSPKLIKDKGETLRKRIWLSALLSGTVGLVPIPGVSLTVDLGIIQAEKVFFAKQLGIAKDGVFQTLATGTGSALSATTVDVLRSLAEECGKELSEEYIKSLLISEAAEMTRFVPVIGSIIASVSSYIGTRHVLHKVLDKMIDDTLKLNMLIGVDLAEGEMISR